MIWLTTYLLFAGLFLYAVISEYLMGDAPASDFFVILPLLFLLGMCLGLFKFGKSYAMAKEQQISDWLYNLFKDVTLPLS